MDKVMPTLPASVLRRDQSKIFAQLEDSPILLTHHGAAAGVLIHPDQWNQLLDLLEDLEDVAIAQERLAEAREDADAVVALAEAKESLIAQGLLDD